MSLKGLKFIEKKNIPWSLSFREEPEFFMYRLTRESSNLGLHYLVESREVSICITDHQKSQELQSIIEVTKGGLNGDKGRWTPKER